jgi:dethiobiotin synthetase
MTAGFFITGTDTGVGKTCIAAALVCALRQRGVAVCGLKPVASGATRGADGLRNEDALALARESSRALPYDLVNPYCFEPAIAPHLAAIDADAQVTVEGLASWYRRATEGFDVAIIEGAGGWRLPLHPRGFLSDFVEALGLPVLLVVGLRLGCLNHARLTLEAIERGGRSRFVGWIGNAIDSDFALLERNLHSLTQLLGCRPLATIGHMPRPDVAEVARHLDRSDVLAALATPI